MLPYYLNISMCSDSNIPSTVTFIVNSYTFSVIEPLGNMLSFFCMESSLQEIPCQILSGLGPLILLKSNFPEFWTFRVLKIGL